MEDRLALRPPHEVGRMSGQSELERDENEDEKVYYGFGVFMGLPLADLRAMKEEFEQAQGAMVHRGGRPSAPGRNTHAPAGMPPQESYGEYEMGRSHGISRGNGADYGRGPPPCDVPGHNPMHQRHFSNPSGAPHHREYDAGGNGNHDGHGSDGSEGSDGSYSAPKLHSLNFILH
ncbi:hypothetical protein Poli38472_004304 [Pythium oligandrum]|uniref:Uncharacterized protein n=1 Tax=Pythium oligandrum TaxID=41045 RepID=A0A8K1FMR0_PYTOL|nr:hypothetical protein Poli38472_004304 [Pythium oligandrum]|eukprot:TMW66539.1 hypothetical protein Poli38472_004304 [Pythium oligandrum]